MRNIQDLLIHTEATLDAMNRKADRTVSFRFTTMYEVSNEDFALMDKFHKEAGHLLFRRNEFTQEDVPSEDVETDIAKSQSTQIRDALWVLYRAKGHDPADKDAWNTFYRRQQQIYKSRILEEVRKLEDN